MAEKRIKGPKNLERYFKGVANHRRIQILLLIAKHPDMTLFNIAEAVTCNFKTISEHVRKLVLGGLVEKTYAGREVRHTLTPYGREFHGFIQRFSNAE